MLGDWLPDLCRPDHTLYVSYLEYNQVEAWLLIWGSGSTCQRPYTCVMTSSHISRLYAYRIEEQTRKANQHCNEWGPELKADWRVGLMVKVRISRFSLSGFNSKRILPMSDISTHGTDWGDCLKECFWLIVTNAFDVNNSVRNGPLARLIFW